LWIGIDQQTRLVPTFALNAAADAPAGSRSIWLAGWSATAARQ
jgi:hypothetical protein